MTLATHCHCEHLWTFASVEYIHLSHLISLFQYLPSQSQSIIWQSGMLSLHPVSEVAWDTFMQVSHSLNNSGCQLKYYSHLKSIFRNAKMHSKTHSWDLPGAWWNGHWTWKQIPNCVKQRPRHVPEEQNFCWLTSGGPRIYFKTWAPHTCDIKYELPWSLAACHQCGWDWCQNSNAGHRWLLSTWPRVAALVSMRSARRVCLFEAVRWCIHLPDTES